MPSIMEDNDFDLAINVRDAMKAADAAKESGDKETAIKWINAIYAILDIGYMNNTKI